MLPAWLHNGLVGFESAPTWEDKIGDLALTSLHGYQWLDTNRVKGDSRNERIVLLARRLLEKVCDWSLLESTNPHNAVGICHGFYKRLRGLSHG